MVTEKRLKQRIAYLNDLYGFKGRSSKGKYKSGKMKGRWKPQTGSGFVLASAYGGYRLEFMTKRGGARDVSTRGTKAEIDFYIGAMITALRYKKEATKLK